MVLQREMPIRIWGTAEETAPVTVTLNGAPIWSGTLEAGDFSILLPAQPAAEDATLTIGDVTLTHVDIGEVWIAGGQSNMEFMLKFSAEWPQEQHNRHDEHLRMYTVGQYSYPEQRAEGYKAWNPWDRWIPYTGDNGGEFSAVATFFAKELRKNGVPVGIVNLSWGSTSASAWLDRACLEQDERLRSYVDDFNTLVSNLNMPAYLGMKAMMRPQMASPQGMQMMEAMMLHTLAPQDFLANMGAGGGLPPLPPFVDPAKVAPDKFLFWGPGDQNEPGTLYTNMVLEVAGLSAKGVIFYQGESDCFKDAVYDRLLSALIACWRKTWQERNSAMPELPFLAVELAPYGMWAMSPAEDYTLLREQQERVASSVSGVHLAVISDLGNVYDIHPKVKQPVGQRLALLARKYVYGEDVEADAPAYAHAEKQDDTVKVYFDHAQGLHKVEADFSSYNGFPVEKIRPDLLPPVLDGVNGLELLVKGERVSEAAVTVTEGCLTVTAPALRDAQIGETALRFAKTGFHQVNLFNAQGLPMRPWCGTV